MRLFALPQRHIAAHGSTGMTLYPVPRPASAGDVQVVVVELAAGGRIGRHPAASWQTLVVTSGEGQVCGEDVESAPIRSGQAVVWAPGEAHETTTQAGLVATIVESEVEPDIDAFAELTAGA